LSEDAFLFVKVGIIELNFELCLICDSAFNIAMIGVYFQGCSTFSARIPFWVLKHLSHGLSLQYSEVMSVIVCFYESSVSAWFMK